MSFRTLQPSSPSPSPPPSSDSAVQVAVRIRPLNPREAGLHAQPLCRRHPGSANTVLLEPPTHRTNRRSLSPLYADNGSTEAQTFGYDFVYDDNEQQSAGGGSGSGGGEAAAADYQQRVFDDIGLQILDNALSGYNVSLLAYGQTSSGKTYSMMGHSDEHSSTAGLIPRVCSALFEHINTAPSTSASGDKLLRKVECSYLEIYSEKIRDLLDPTHRNLRIRENPKTGPYVDGLSVCAVSSYDELAALMSAGNAERTIASTNMNAESSRSHAVFTVIYTQTTMDEATKLSSDVVSKVQLVDLAGSERVEQSGASGVRLREASQINKSLTTLGRVVQSLAQRSEEREKALGGAGAGGPLHRHSMSIGGTMGVPQRRPRASVMSKNDDVFIPFRDSVLTWLLKESLGGNSRTFMLACVSPADSNWEETVSTLRYASRAKSIVNTARINEDPNAQLIRTLKAEIDTLRSQLAQSTTATSLPLPAQSPSSSNVLTFTYAATEPSPNSTIREKDDELLQMNAHIARLQAELTASSVSMLEREAAWEARLQEARELEARRMRDMEGRGVSVRRNETELPFLVNLNEDPALSESLIYYVADGTTTVGSRKRGRRKAQSEQDHERIDGAENGGVERSGADEERKESEDESDDEDDRQDKERRIVLSGIHVKEDHCTLTKHAHGIIIAPIPSVQAETHVNGELLNEERLLVHGDRVVIGGQHYFRFSRSKAAIEADRAREDERRRKKKEDMKARISIDTSSHLITPTPATPSASPVPADEGVYDFEFAQRELIVGGGGDGAARITAALNASRGGVGGAGNRSMNRSAYEDIEPDSSPDQPLRPTRALSASASSLPSARTADGATITLEQLHATPSKSPTSPSSALSPTHSPTPPPAAPAKVSEEKEKDREDDGAELQVPKFHLGRDVKGSIDWSSRRALTKGEIDEWIRHDRRYLAKHQQRLIDKQHAACVALMQPLQHYSALEYKLASHAAYRWRWHVIKAALREEIMRLVFLCDEANAICSALGRPERYKVELASSHNVLPEVFLSLHPRSQLSQPQCSPLQRLRQLKVVFCQVVEVRRRMLPLPVLSFDLLTFQEQLAVLREHYNDMLEGQDDTQQRTITPSTTGTVSLSSASSPASSVSSLLALPSTQLYSHPQLLGRAFCFLHALRYGHSVKHSAVVLDERGEQAGVLTMEIELASVDEDVARKEIAAEEKLRGKEDRDEESRRAINLSVAEADEEDEQSTDIDPLSPSTQSDDEQKNVNTFLSAHRVLALIVRVLSYDTQTRQLRRCGLQSVWVKYHVKDSTVAYRSKKLSVRDDTSRYAVDMERSHYFSGMDLQGLTDWLEFDCVVFELWCMVDDSSKGSQTTLTSSLSDTLLSQRENGHRPRSSMSPSPSPLGSDDGLMQNEDDEVSTSADHDRRESLAKRMQSPLNRSASKESTPQKRETEKSLHSRAPSHLTTTAHHRRSTFGSSSLIAPIKSVDDERVLIENGQKAVDHLLFCAVDVEEDVGGGAGGGAGSSKGAGGYAGCSLKEEGAVGQMVFRVGLRRDHRLVISLLQVDQRPFVLESLSSVTVTALSLSTGSSRYSPPLPAPISIPIVEQFAHVDHKLLVCTTGWPRALEEHTFFSHASAAGERITLSLRLECFFSRTTAPVLVSVDTQVKVYKGGSLDKPSLFGKKAGVSESERLARIGLHVSVTRQSSPQTVGNVVREHELVLEQLQRRLRFEHRRQQQQLINKLRSTQPHLLAEVDQLHMHGADGLTRHFTLRFSRILADLRRRGGIQVAVERVSPDSGVRCGFLNERRRPAAPFEPKWAVLRPPYLFLYNRRGEKKEQCIVRLMKADYVKGDPTTAVSPSSLAAGSAPFVWSIKTTAGAVCTLQAANEGEMKSWLRALGANLSAMGMTE